MNDYTFASIAAVAFALATAFLLIPLARLIANWMESQWLRQSADQAELVREEDSFLRLPGYPTYVTVAIGAALGFIAFAIDGASAESIGLSIYFFSLLLLLTINIRHLLLPDVVVLPTLGAALLYRALNGSATVFVYGAVAGFFAPYMINFFIRLRTQREFIGMGDMKAFAMAGAWFGLASLPVVFTVFIVGSTAYGIVVAMIGRAAGKPILLASGPGHLMASLAAVLCASPIAFTLSIS